jgi:hypothetical protein
MDKRIINHPAFPVLPHPGDETTPATRGNSGISIRDLLAAVAMHALVQDFTADDAADVAEMAYQFSDALLLKRQGLE